MTTPKWKSEAAMCDAFMAQARLAGFDVYPETAGFDMLLVATERVGGGFEAGDQVAVEAKLTASVKLMTQILPPELDYNQPAADFYVAVVPRRGAVHDFRKICHRLGIGVESGNPPRVYEWGAEPDPAFAFRFGPPGWPRYPRTGPRLWTPPVVVNGPAGMPSPKYMTPWKIAAVRLCLECSDKELTSKDFKARGLNIRLFIEKGWVRKVGHRGRLHVYRLSEHSGRPDAAYPDVAEALDGHEFALAPRVSDTSLFPLTKPESTCL